MMRMMSSQGSATSTTQTHPTKPFSDIPGDWRGSLPVLAAMPLFLPYVHKETSGLRAEDFMIDYYTKYGKKDGIAQWGARENRVAVIFDDGYLQVFQKEGKYPSGILAGAWPIAEYNEKYVEGNPKNPFLQDGEDWRKGRMAINPYLFNIKEAQSYIPAINESVNNAAKHFKDYATTGKLDQFCELSAFDMFTAASLGLQINSVGGDERGLHFARNIIGGLATMAAVSTQCPYSKYDIFKFSAWDRFKDEWTKGREASKELVRLAFEGGEGSGKGIMHGFLGDRDLQVSNEEATEMYLILTFAAADTTSSVINNVLTNLAKYPEIQDRVRAEMADELGGEDYHPEGTKLKYFEQVLKESQRLTPPLPFTNVKNKIPKDLIVNGYEVPSGTTVIFSHMGIASDERLAGPEPHKFNPDRFSDDMVAARKGTKAEFLDHPLARSPFGFGARMCVGSRIAKLEYTSLICRLIQDYEILIDEERSPPKDLRFRLTKTTTVEYPCPSFKVNRLQ
jgi:cytochrome P450